LDDGVVEIETNNKVAIWNIDALFCNRCCEKAVGIAALEFVESQDLFSKRHGAEARIG
jgi:hypothetical protein